ncbi:hypothetical protein BDF19DRAFT_244111 [Syncephalis fuscata]|nr:hypothetical protein BDF19DRAFT_244111 [Syncephalis fuscata]
MVVTRWAAFHTQRSTLRPVMSDGISTDHGPTLPGAAQPSLEAILRALLRFSSRIYTSHIPICGAVIVRPSVTEWPTWSPYQRIRHGKYLWCLGSLHHQPGMRPWRYHEVWAGHVAVSRYARDGGHGKKRGGASGKTNGRSESSHDELNVVIESGPA